MGLKELFTVIVDAPCISKFVSRCGGSTFGVVVSCCNCGLNACVGCVLLLLAVLVSGHKMYLRANKNSLPY